MSKRGVVVASAALLAAFLFGCSGADDAPPPEVHFDHQPVGCMTNSGIFYGCNGAGFDTADISWSSVDGSIGNGCTADQPNDIGFCPGNTDCTVVDSNGVKLSGFCAWEASRL